MELAHLPCTISPMAKKTISNSQPERRSGKPARNSGSVVSSAVGVKARKKFTLAFIVSAVRNSAGANSEKQVKQFYTDKGAEILAKAIAKAFTLPTLSSEDISTDASESKARREFAKRHKASLIDADKVLRKNTTDRTENAIRARLESVATSLNIPQDTLYAVRATPYRKGEKSKVYVVLK